MLAVAEHPAPIGQASQDALALDQGARTQVPAIEVQQVEGIEVEPVVGALR